MHPKIESRFHALERQRYTFLEQIAALSEAQRQFRPLIGDWCALEVLEHVVVVEVGLSEHFLNAAALEPIPLEPVTLKPITLRSQVMGWALVAALHTSFRVKTPSPTALPRRVPTLEEAGQRWQNHRERMQTHLESLPVQALSRAAINHPVVQPMTLAQALAFFTGHLRHHQYQLERLRKASGV